MKTDLARRKKDRTAERLLPSTAVCPVCERVFEPDQETEYVEFAGHILWLCDDRCRTDFDRQPLRYSE